KGKVRGKSDDITDLLLAALEATEDSSLQAALTSQISRLGAKAEASGGTPNTCTIKQFNQSSGFARIWLQRSSKKNLARKLAEADQAKKAAATALTKAEGLDKPQGVKGDDDTETPKLFTLQWDQAFFDQ
ncbi:unnamed protein product, partial [Prorocentrum cordatum]